jgi:phosphomannomutase
MDSTILDSVFHAYDIRGKVPKELNEKFYYKLGQALAVYLDAKKLYIGYDIRKDSQKFSDAMSEGIMSQGCNVVNIGEIPTEMIYFAAGRDIQADGGAIVTASHNPSGWNGCKIVREESKPISGDSGLNDIKNLILKDDFEDTVQKGKITKKNIYPEYKEKMRSFIGNTNIKPLEVVVDAGNGIGGKVFDYVFADLPLEVEKMYFKPDGSFPNHTPDPIKEENVEEIKQMVVQKGADLGIAIDGDADRVFFIDNKGRNPNGVYTGNIIARYLLKDAKVKKVVHDPRITWPIKKEIKDIGAKSIICKAGHSFFKERLRKERGIFAAEVSSHFYYKDFYYADSAMATIALILKIISEGLDFNKKIDTLYKKYPNSGEINYKVDDADKTIEKAADRYSDGEVKYIDGVSVEFEDWRFNLRKSNTQPLVRLNIEAINKDLIVEHFIEIEKLIGGKRDNKPSLECLR